MADLALLAIEAAQKNDWPQAVKLNLRILSQSPADIDALNRLAHAYCELGKISQAKRVYHQVLQIDPYNPLAKKKLKQLNDFKREQVLPPGPNHTFSSCFFLEEPGKTKVVTLINPAPASVLLTLSPGDPVDLVLKKHQVAVTREKTYLGAFPDDLAHRVIYLTRLGNKYEATVLSVEGNTCQIFLQETKRGKRLGNQPSFPPQGVRDYYPSVRKGSLGIGSQPSDFDSEEKGKEEDSSEEE